MNETNFEQKMMVNITKVVCMKFSFQQKFIWERIHRKF